MLVSAAVCYAGGTITLSTKRDCNERSGCMDVYRWDFTIAGSAAEDTTKWIQVFGKLVGAKAIEGSIGTATTIKLLDGAGRDVLQGLFTDTEMSATATADNHYRVPVDDTSGGYIYLNDPIYVSVSAGTDGETGAIELYVVPFNASLPEAR
jgi:hypothetical protein